jgi:hypothetical protein
MEDFDLATEKIEMIERDLVNCRDYFIDIYHDL